MERKQTSPPVSDLRWPVGEGGAADAKAAEHPPVRRRPTAGVGSALYGRDLFRAAYGLSMEGARCYRDLQRIDSA
jgi:hypothetical protein